MPQKPLTDDELLEALRIVSEYGSISEAARQLDINRETLQHRVNRARNKVARGTLDPELSTRVPEGHKVKGVSTLYREDGTIGLQWVKTDIDQSKVEDAFKTAIQDLCDNLKGKAPQIQRPKYTDADVLTVVPMGDPHFGLLSWKPETGEDFDTGKAEEMTFGAVDMLTDMTPAEALRAAADAVENRVVSDREARVILLMSLHIMRTCEAREDEARLLMALLDGG